MCFGFGKLPTLLIHFLIARLLLYPQRDAFLIITATEKHMFSITVPYDYESYNHTFKAAGFYCQSTSLILHVCVNAQRA